MEETTQFSISTRTKDRLEKFKADKREHILQRYAKRRRMVTNSATVEFLLDVAGARK